MRGVMLERLPNWFPICLFVPPILLWLAVLMNVGFGIYWPVALMIAWAPDWSFLLFGLICPAIALWIGAFECRVAAVGHGLAVGFGGLFFLVLMLFSTLVTAG